MSKPYVVSGDIRILVNEWAKERSFVLPSQEFFHQLQTEFSAHMCQIFPSFDFVSEKELATGAASLISQSTLPIISLDQVYFRSKVNLEITRLVDNKGKDCGFGHRAGSPSLSEQIRVLQLSGIREAILADDVIFTGALIERVVDLFSKIGIQTPLVYTGIGIAEGINRITQSKREVRCVRRYEEVIDEICERDFYPGVPFSGRQLVGNENIGVPYLLPFGNPMKWASIPTEWQVPFSRFCLQQTIRLFEEIEKCSNRVVSCAELGRLVFSLPKDGTRFVDALRAL